jgi:hypothetical protein
MLLLATSSWIGIILLGLIAAFIFKTYFTGPTDED